MKLSEIASALNSSFKGNDIHITGLNTLEDASSSELSFLANPKYIHLLAHTKAGAVVVHPNHANEIENAILSESPYQDFARIAMYFEKKEGSFEGISSLAYVSTSATIGKNVTIYPYVFVSDNVVLHDNVVLFPHCYVGENTSIGENTIISPSVTIMSNTSIGKNCTIKPGAVIASAGYGFIPTKEGIFSIPQIGTVTINNNVSVGANTTIDRAALNSTIIEQNTKIDNLVQIGHNVAIGSNCLIISQTGISGSTKIGNNVIIAGQAGIAGHLFIGDNVTIGPKSGIAQDIPAGETRAGIPATDKMTFLRLSHIFPKLPKIIKEHALLKQRVALLEEKINSIS
ncbi:MAG: UDP-3-O-(3-hydroxymyristoyl)glucosamine N-acyltransferase [Desulfovibrionaceae bacterium]